MEADLRFDLGLGAGSLEQANVVVFPPWTAVAPQKDMLLAGLAHDAGAEEIQALSVQGDVPALATLGLGADVDQAGIEIYVLG